MGAMRTCSTYGCPELVERGACWRHARLSSRNHGGVSRHLLGHGSEYDRAARKLAGQPCELRYAGCTGAASGGDHVIPVSQGGTIADGLRPACSHCQSVQGARLVNAARAR